MFKAHIMYVGSILGTTLTYLLTTETLEIIAGICTIIVSALAGYNYYQSAIKTKEEIKLLKQQTNKEQ